eukprot:TRINITY_DN163_c0_g1_i10.p1 TRINITY_DN163_c0_g1~~TRINITY_DN163_c0_g1_i10.p1  ORF type:complete len:408 (+),score=103.73 TRINITY_DN163_c0_g1_i10:114-1337(+)
MASAFEQLFGSQLTGQEGASLDTASALGGKYVGIYFSAHWCPPCRGFTPKLASFYKENKEKLNLEIVFVSSDRDEKSFAEYFGEMPWLSLPYADRGRKGKLSNQFKVQGIPTFVILSPEGELITKDGREEVSSDAKGARFPWKPKTIAEVMSGKYLSKGGDVTEADFAGKTLGLYFSAHWCPPCRKFTPELVQFYHNMKAKRSDFEIIFVTGDNSEEEFAEYFGEMPWLAIPYDDEERKGALNRIFEVEGIPHFLILDSSHNVVNDDARGSVSSDLEGNKFPWPLEPVSPISEGVISHVNKRPCLLILTESESAEVDAKLGEILPPIIAAHTESVKAAGKADTALVAFYGKSEVNANIRRFLKVTGSETIAVILNLPEQVKSHKAIAATAEDIEAFVKAYEDGTLPK